MIRDLTQNTTATATSLSKRFNEQNSGCARVIILGSFLYRRLQNSIEND